jgi:hypothetical protein
MKPLFSAGVLERAGIFILTKSELPFYRITQMKCATKKVTAQ